MNKYRGLVAGICGISVISILALSASSCKISSGQKAGQMAKVGKQQMPLFGMWVWQPEWIGSHKEQDRLIDFCTTHGINRLLVQIHLTPNWDKEGIAKLQYQKPLKRLLKKATAANIRVEALDGSPEMGNANNHAKVLAIVDAVLEFNRELPPNERFIGMHYDIEPYATPQWHTEKRHQIMQDYLELFKYIRAKLIRETPKMVLAASIPFWYDQLSDGNNSCITVYRGERKNFHEHIQDLTEYVAIMSYRRTAVGQNSITELIEAEVKYANLINRFVCAGMETIKLPESPELSFSDMSPESFWSVKTQVDERMNSRNGFGGIFVHDYKGFRQLIEGKETNSPPTAKAN